MWVSFMNADSNSLLLLLPPTVVSTVLRGSLGGRSLLHVGPLRISEDARSQ